jgi:hypothetical protein
MELLTLLKRIEHRGAIETTHRVQQNCGQVFEHYPTLTDARDVCRLLRDIEAYEGGFITKCAMKLSPMLFVRPR